MKKTHLLRTLVAIQVLLTCASAGAEGFFGWTLPPVLAQYSHARFAASPLASFGSVYQLLFLLTATAFAFAAWLGLVLFWRGARRLYLVSSALGMLLILVTGARVETSIGAVFGEMSAVIGGVIIGLVYFSELARRFEHAPAESAAPIGLDPKTHQA